MLILYNIIIMYINSINSISSKSMMFGNSSRCLMSQSHMSQSNTKADEIWWFQK